MAYFVACEPGGGVAAGVGGFSIGPNDLTQLTLELDAGPD